MPAIRIAPSLDNLATGLYGILVNYSDKFTESSESAWPYSLPSDHHNTLVIEFRCAAVFLMPASTTYS